jgi:hypothetical protein
MIHYLWIPKPTDCTSRTYQIDVEAIHQLNMTSCCVHEIHRLASVHGDSFISGNTAALKGCRNDLCCRSDSYPFLACLQSVALFKSTHMYLHTHSINTRAEIHVYILRKSIGLAAYANSVESIGERSEIRREVQFTRPFLSGEVGSMGGRLKGAPKESLRIPALPARMCPTLAFWFDSPMECTPLSHAGSIPLTGE